MDNITKNLGDMMIGNNTLNPNTNSKPNPNNKPNPNTNTNSKPNPNNKPNPNPNTNTNTNPNTNPNTNSNPEGQKDTKSVELKGKGAELMTNNPNTANTNTPTPTPKKNNTKNNTKKNNKSKNANLTMKATENKPESNSPEGNENTSTANTTSANNDNNVMISLNKLTMNLLNHQIVIKLFHFQTKLFGAHKASDAYLEKFAQTMDKFLEIAQGIYGKITIKKYTLTGSSHSDDNIVKNLDGIITSLRENIDDILQEYTDLINIRDELVGDAEQLKYLLTFK
jgi:DNA-binding ferritin-like protein